MMLKSARIAILLVFLILFINNSYQVSTDKSSKNYLSNKAKNIHQKMKKTTSNLQVHKLTTHLLGANATANGTNSSVAADLELKTSKSGNVSVQSYLTNSGNPNLHDIFIEKNNTACDANTAINECRDTMCSMCTYIEDLDNYFVQKPCYIATNMYTASLYEAQDPALLIESQDLVNADLATPIAGAPKCFTMNARTENKTMSVCLLTPKRNDEFQSAFFAYARCRQGLSPRGGLPSLADCQKLFGSGAIATKGTAGELDKAKNPDSVAQNAMATLLGSAA